MPVPYEELPSSPEIDVERRTGSGRRQVVIPWDRIDDILEEIFPDPLSGYLYGAAMPGFPALVATKVGIKPFVETLARADSDDWTAWHPLAQLSVEYGVPKDDQQQQSGPTGDGTGPGGSGGSSGGQEVTFLSHKVSTGGEFLTYPSDGCEWEDDARAGGAAARTAGAVKYQTEVLSAVASSESTIVLKTFNVPTGNALVFAAAGIQFAIRGVTANADRSVAVTVDREGSAATFSAGQPVEIYSNSAKAKTQRGVGDNVAAAVIVPTKEHTIEWNYVAQPPWAAMRYCMGRVNAYPFAGCPYETLLFLGGECSREVTSKGVKRWKLSYKFSEKNANPFDAMNPMGWNYFLRPNGDKAGQFQRLGKKVKVNEKGDPPKTTLGGFGTGIVTVGSTGGSFPQTGSFCVKSGGRVHQINGPVGNGTQWFVTQGIRNTFAASDGPDVVQIAGGLYDCADFRYLFV